MAGTLRDVAAPTVVVVGARDPLCRDEWAAGLATAGYLRLPGLPHCVPHRDPDGFARVLREQLAGSR